jgi:hypothetical protein
MIKKRISEMQFYPSISPVDYKSVAEVPSLDKPEDVFIVRQLVDCDVNELDKSK